MAYLNNFRRAIRISQFSRIFTFNKTYTNSIMFYKNNMRYQAIIRNSMNSSAPVNNTIPINSSVKLTIPIPKSYPKEVSNVTTESNRADMTNYEYINYVIDSKLSGMNTKFDRLESIIKSQSTELESIIKIQSTRFESMIKALTNEVTTTKTDTNITVETADISGTGMTVNNRMYINYIVDSRFDGMNAKFDGFESMIKAQFIKQESMIKAQSNELESLIKKLTNEVDTIKIVGSTIIWSVGISGFIFVITSLVKSLITD